jgi:hypothetical protein
MRTSLRVKPLRLIASASIRRVVRLLPSSVSFVAPVLMSMAGSTNFGSLPSRSATTASWW